MHLTLSAMKKPKHYINQPEYLIPYGHWVSVDLRPEGEFFPSELNDALLIDEAYNSGVTFKHSRITSDGYAVSVMDMTIPHGLKLGEVFDRVPYGIINKTITGLGATTLELMTPKRNSIIVVPTKTLAYSKVLTANKAKGDNYAMYIGSPICEVKSNINLTSVRDYVRTKGSDDVNKFVVVADSLPMLLNYLSQLDIDVYSDYFLMVDEIDTLQSDSSYRPRLEMVIDHYFKFDFNNRAVVSATIIPFSNPLFAQEPYLKIVWDKQPVRKIHLLYTNYAEDAAINEINNLLQTTQDKILVAYNSLDGIFNIIDQLDITKKECGILCSERSSDKVTYYKDDSEEAIDKDGNLLNRVTFMTCAYFAGIDIQDRCHLITISSKNTAYTYLSVNKMTQIAGRGRNGNISETIIYNIPEKTEYDRFGNIEEYRDSLLSRATKYITFLNAAQEMIAEDRDLEPMEYFIKSYMSYISQSKPTVYDYPLTIIRQDSISDKFVPAYFNIDSLLEKWTLRHTLYTSQTELEKALKEDGQEVITMPPFLLQKEEHVKLDNEARKKADKIRKEKELENLKQSLIEWHNSHGNEYALEAISSKVNKKLNDTVVKAFKLLHLCYPAEELLDILMEGAKNVKIFRNIYNAAVFHALPLDDTFKAKVILKFGCNPTTGKSECYIDYAQRQNLIAECWIETFMVRPKTLENNLPELATSFLKFKTSKGKYCPDGFNPKELPTIISTLPVGILTADMFMLPSLKD